MENRPLVSIVVPCYNLGQYLEETLQSVEATTYENWECVIVDDGSSDSTGQIAEQWCATHPKFTYLHKQNGGQSSARNLGVRASKGEYILPLDADDKIAPTYVEKCVEVLEQDPSAGIVYCRAQKFKEQKYRDWELPPYSLDLMLRTNVVFSCAMYRREDYDKTAGYDENRECLYEDWDFWLSLIELGCGVHCIDEVLFYYRVRKLSFSHKVKGRGKWRAIFIVVSNHLPLYAAHSENKAVLEIATQLLGNKEFSLGNNIYSGLRKLSALLKSPLRIFTKQ